MPFSGTAQALHARNAATPVARVSPQMLADTLELIGGLHLPAIVKSFLRAMAQGDTALASKYLRTFPQAFTPDALRAYRHMTPDELELYLPEHEGEAQMASLEELGIEFAQAH